MAGNSNRRAKTANSTSTAPHEKPRILREERLEARLSAEQKRVISRAANLEDEPMSSFVIRAAVNAAKSRILEEETIKLTQKDRAALVAALMNPPAPNKKLRAAFNRYAKELPG